MLGITPRHVRNLAARLGGRRVGSTLTFDRAAIDIEIAHRKDVA